MSDRAHAVIVGVVRCRVAPALLATAVVAAVSLAVPGRVTATPEQSPATHDPSPPPASAATVSLAVGSKKFTESVILGEIVTQLIRSTGVEATHRDQLGGTRVLWNSLVGGEIDVYPEYTGTLRHEILGLGSAGDDDAVAARLAAAGVSMTAPLGFNNTYALGMTESKARELGVETITDLQRHPRLRFGFTSEFMDRADGWPGLRRRYSLPQPSVRGLDHDLAYRGLASDGLDVIDLYSTDAEIRYHRLRVLADDLRYFPDYHAVVLYRSDLATRAPAAVAAISRLEGLIGEQRMIALNAAAKLERQPEVAVAASFLAERLGIHTTAEVETRRQRIARRTLEHLGLVALSLAAAIVVAIPLGIVAARRARIGQLVLGLVGIVQTIPSLALLVFMIPLLGIGAPPALAALFLYSLLPIVRNTYTGLHDIRPELLESADAMGLPRRARLRIVELPLATRSILAGIKTSAVINIGTATLGALIGAGGYGQPILTGIRLDDIGLILEGAVPAALLALAAQGLFDLGERLVVPRGLRLAASE